MLTKDSIRPICRECKNKPARSGGRSRGGYQRWRPLCASCDSSRYRKSRVVSLTCVKCGFIASDSCQIDTVDNQSWCSNCNRLRIKSLKQKRREQYELTVDVTVDIDSVRL